MLNGDGMKKALTEIQAQHRHIIEKEIFFDQAPTELKIER